VLAADAANDIGLELGVLSEAGRTALAPQLPAQATLQELFDLSEDATPAQYRAAIDAALAERQIAGVLTLFSPKPGNDARAVAQALADAKRQAEKPLLSCWLGDATVGEAREVLRDASIPTFRTPEAAVGAFSNMANYHINQQLLQQTPAPLSSNLAQPDIEGARLVIEGVLAERRSVLTEMESKTLLAAFHIPVTRTLLARNTNEAMMIATQLGFPVALKIDSPDITHKSDVGGVVLNIQTAASRARRLRGHGAARGARGTECAHQRRHGATHGTGTARTRGVHRPGARRPLRPRHHLRRRRHHDRADWRPRHGAAPAQPIPGAAPD